MQSPNLRRRRRSIAPTAIPVHLPSGQKMDKHFYEKLKIENFRGIKSLEIDDLAQVNLFVGKNGCGKTSVLGDGVLADWNVKSHLACQYRKLERTKYQ